MTVELHVQVCMCDGLNNVAFGDLAILVELHLQVSVTV